MPTSELAIIGMAGRFPSAPDLDRLREVLQQGKETLGPLSTHRIATHALEPEAKYKVMGYLDDISIFDYDVFGIVAGEARKLSPNMRLLLEEVWHMFESTGCSPEQFRGSRTDVYMTQTDSAYGDLADEDSATLFTGNAPEFLVGRINRVFDLRGNSVIVDTACSSGLSAVLLACDSLRMDRADYALVCGANLYIFPYERPNVLETASPDGRSRSYAADANGMVSGEAVVCFLITTRERAEALNYPVQAIIRGGALNSNGIMSSSPSAPNSVMQAQAMVEAWRRSDILPEQLGFVEGHGSGTLLGDSLELEAFRLAFKNRAKDWPPCALSSIKFNIGHGKSAASLSGLAKAVLSVQYGEIYPTPHTGELNPVLSKPDSPVYVNTTLLPWSDKRRLAGVHSYGMSGVNCHLVLENAHETREREAQRPEWYLAPISSRRSPGLTENVAALRAWLGSNGETALSDVAHTLCLGRQKFDFRCAVLARTCQELATAFDQLLVAPTRDPGDRPASPIRIVLLFTNVSASVPLLRDAAEQLSARFASFEHAMATYASLEIDGAAFVVAFQLALHGLLSKMGIQGAIAGVGPGKLVASVVSGSIAPEQALRDAASLDGELVDDWEARAAKLVSRPEQHGHIVYIQMGCESKLSSAIKERIAGPSRVESVGTDAVRSIGEIVARLFEDGAAINFAPWFEDRDTRPARLPGYRFARTRCWLRDAPMARLTSTADDPKDELMAWDREWAHAPYSERRVAEIWRELLGRGDFGREDSIFELGGDSLLVTRFIRRLNHELDIRCDFEDVFDCPTVAGLARIVESQSTTSKMMAALWRDVLKVEKLNEGDNFFELGGHSLIATEILLRVRQEFATTLSFDDLFAAPTPAEFVKVLETRQQLNRVGGVSPARPNASPSADIRPPLDAASWAEQLRRRETS